MLSCVMSSLRGLASVPRYNYGLPGKGKERRVKNKYLPQKFSSRGEVLFGIHPVLLALKAKRRQCFHSLYVKAARSASPKEISHEDSGETEVDWERQERSAQIEEVCAVAEAAGIPIHPIHPAALDVLSGSRPHQGVCLDTSRLRIPRLYTSAPRYQQVWTQQPPPIWLLLHNIQDPMNLGAVLRSACYFGVDQVILPNTNSCRLTPVVSKASAGAMEVMDLVSLSPDPGSLDAVLTWWREGKGQILGTACVGTARASLSVCQVQVQAPTLLIMGNEGEGLAEEVLRHCDSVITIPPGSSSSSSSAVQSLNVSVATGIILSHLLPR